MSYALISSSKVSRVRTGIACALAAAPWLVLRGLRAVAFVAAAVLAFVVRSSRSRLFTVDRDGSASFRGRRSGTLRARSCESCTRQSSYFKVATSGADVEPCAFLASMVRLLAKPG